MLTTQNIRMCHVLFCFIFSTTIMALVPSSSRNRVNPIPISTIEPPTVPYAAYHQVEFCADPYCQVCRGQRYNRHQKHRHKRHHHHHHRHHHRQYKKNFWDGFLPRVESASSTITIDSVELNERRPYYHSHVNERALVPVSRTERRVVPTTRRTRRRTDDDIARDAWVSFDD